jgi:hypothetical protein
MVLAEDDIKSTHLCYKISRLYSHLSNTSSLLRNNRVIRLEYAKQSILMDHCFYGEQQMRTASHGKLSAFRYLPTTLSLLRKLSPLIVSLISLDNGDGGPRR